jgi:hypothetical protein
MKFQEVVILKNNKSCLWENLYDNSETPNWPPFQIEPPYLVPGSEEAARINTNITFRISFQLNKTIEEHCRTMRVGKSEWIRASILAFLSAEQRWIEKNQLFRGHKPNSSCK